MGVRIKSILRAEYLGADGFAVSGPGEDWVILVNAPTQPRPKKQFANTSSRPQTVKLEGAYYGQKGPSTSSSYDTQAERLEQLAAMVGVADVYSFQYSPDEKVPFCSLLITVNDDEAYFDQDACKNIYVDFEKWQSSAQAHPDEFFREFYAEVHRVFKAAAENEGIVYFE